MKPLPLTHAAARPEILSQLLLKTSKVSHAELHAGHAKIATKGLQSEAFLEEIEFGSGLDQGSMACSICHNPPPEGAIMAASSAVPGTAEPLELLAQHCSATVEGAHQLPGMICRYLLKDLVPIWPAMHQHGVVKGRLGPMTTELQKSCRDILAFLKTHVSGLEKASESYYSCLVAQHNNVIDRLCMSLPQ